MLVVTDTLADKRLEQRLQVDEGEIALLRVSNQELDKSNEAVNAASVRDFVAEQGNIFDTTSLCNSSFVDLDCCYSRHVATRIANQFSEDILVDELLDDAFTSLHMLVLLVAASTVRLG